MSVVLFTLKTKKKTFKQKKNFQTKKKNFQTKKKFQTKQVFFSQHFSDFFWFSYLKSTPIYIFFISLGITLDAALRWKAHVKKQREELGLKLKRYFLIGRRTRLSIRNKLLIYKQTRRSVCTYGIQFWACASQTYITFIYLAGMKIRGIFYSKKLKKTKFTLTKTEHISI